MQAQLRAAVKVVGPMVGNVRQLNHVLRRAVALATAPTLGAVDLFPDSVLDRNIDKPSHARSLSQHLESSERAFLVATLQEPGGAVGEAANRLGISRKTLWEKMKRHGIDRQQLCADSEPEAVR